MKIFYVTLAVLFAVYYVYIAVASYRRRLSLGDARFKGPIVFSDRQYIFVLAIWPIAIVIWLCYRRICRLRQ